MSFLDLKKSSGNFMSDIQNSIEKSGKQTRETDNTSFYPQLDKDGNGYAVIRFLPPIEGESVPFIKQYSHGFKGPKGRWYIEPCPTTIRQGDDICPACDSNRELWNTGEKGEQEVRRYRKRKLKFVSNVYVVKDPKNPEREGKVYKFSYGVKIFDKIKAIAKPPFEGETAINPFDLWEGANFSLKIQKVDKQTNYDLSNFDVPSALSSDDAELESIWKSGYSLKELNSEEQYSDYATLSKKLNSVLGVTTAAVVKAPQEDPAPKVGKTKSEKAEPDMAMASAPAEDIDDFFADL